MKANVPEDLWKRVDRSQYSPGGCWEWQGSCFTGTIGYGQMKISGKNCYVHRIAYTLVYGDPGEKQVQHLCNNPKCCNPSHLILGTPADNMRYKSVCD